MTVQDKVISNISYPLVLKVWGGSNTCSREKLLFVTEPIKDTYWAKKQYDFNTKDTSYSSILIEVYWDTISQGQPNQAYNGLMLLDSLRLENTGAVDTIKNDTVYFKGDGKTTLAASKGGSYNWTPPENLTAYNIRSPKMLVFSKQYEVIIGNTSKCPSIEFFNIKLKCDSLYPAETIKTYFYKYFRKVVLKASDGVSFDWEPKTGLSSYTAQAPFLTGFHDIFTVTITDKYGCNAKEIFNIFHNCDSLYPSNNIIVLDTFFKGQPLILLVPKVGTIDGLWSPAKWLSCTGCQNPVATPEFSTIYSVNLKDTFDCNHRESFKIGMELFIPNIITPNGDGYNDCFKLIGVPENTIIRIFDKSGQNVFSANNYDGSNCWQGKDNNGINLETGTYWYFLDNHETGFFKKGFVFLKR
jgi:gliding motility-associated-like protein